MIENSETTTKAPDLHLTRTFDAPLGLVWEAWSKAEFVQRWFTPQPLTTPKCEIDFRTGGRFYLVMNMNGVDLPMDAKYDEVTPKSRVAFSGEIHGGVMVKTVVDFAERDGKTTLNIHQTYSKETDATRGSPMGWKATLDQLGDFVKSQM